MSNQNNSCKPWPSDCIWPEPLHDGDGPYWDPEDVSVEDDDLQILYEIKEQMDDLVEEGVLNEDYTLNESSDQEPSISDEASDYWDGEQFDIDTWSEDVSAHVNLLKLYDPRPEYEVANDPTVQIRQIIHYDFINENLLRQAFTRRSFATEYGLSGNSEELEFFGDSILNSIVTKEFYQQFTECNITDTEAPFESHYKEGDLTKLRQHFISKEYLSDRATILGLDKFILYGADEIPTDSSREDMMEALIAAVAIDCNFGEGVIEGVVDNLLMLQLDQPDEFLKKSYYDIFNAWHQSHFDRMPKYSLYPKLDTHFNIIGYDSCIYYYCASNGGTHECSQEGQGKTRSKARENAARRAYSDVVNKGAWINLADAHIIPNRDDSINQLQELYQKKYVEKPSYEFEESDNKWKVDCLCNDIHGFGYGTSKTEAKKKAAFMVLVELLSSSGIRDEKWRREMYRTLTE